MAADTGQAVKPTGGAEEGPAGATGSRKFSRERLKQRGAKFWAGGASAVFIMVIGSWLTVWSVFLAGPHAPTTPTITNPGHLPGRYDVSTMAPKQQFYAEPNFYEFPACGRPCWLPLYESPTEQSALVTNNWPCEFYGPNTSTEPSCVQPPSGRTSAEMADPADKNSGDKLLVVCRKYSEVL
jgi:hypothetical protein